MSNFERRDFLRGIGAGGIGLVAGCANLPLGGGGGGGNTIGISQHQVGGAWVTAFFEAGELYAEQQGYSLETSLHDEDPTQQIQQVRQMINQDYDGIVLVPWDESLNTVIEEATDAGIPVFTANSDATTDAIKSFTAFGNRGAGEICANKMYEALSAQKPDVDTYRVLNVRGDFFGVSNARTDGFVNTITENDDVEIVQTIQTDWSRSQAKSKVSSWLNGNETPHGIYSSNMTSGLGSYAALDQAGLAVPKSEDGHVTITQLDGGPEVNPKIGNGLIDAAVDQPNYFYIPLAIKQMSDYWDDGESTIPQPGTTLQAEDYTFETVEYNGVELWQEPIWAPADVVEKDGHPHVKTKGITITQENADAPYLWGNIWGQE